MVKCITELCININEIFRPIDTLANICWVCTVYADPNLSRHEWIVKICVALKYIVPCITYDYKHCKITNTYFILDQGNTSKKMQYNNGRR